MDIWRTHHAIGLVILCTVFPFYFYKRIGLTACLLWSYCLAHSAIIAFWPGLYERPYVTLSLSTMLKHGAGQALAMGLVIPFFALHLRSRWMDLLAYVCIANVVPVIMNNYGIFNVKSMDVTAMAIAVVFLLSKSARNVSRLNVFMASIGIAGILISGGRTGMASLAFGFLAMFMMRRKIDRRLVIAGVLALPFISYFTFNYLMQNVSSFNARVTGWKTIMTWWMNHGNMIYGMGPGSFEWLIPFVRIPTGEVWIWMHNDYLQFVFEYGFIGSALGLFFLINVIRKSWNTYLFAPLTCSLVAMLAYFPAHFFTSQALILMIMVKSIDKEKRD